MGKTRLGGNKSETRAKRKKATSRKVTMAMEKASARHKVKTSILKKAMPNRKDYEDALTKAPLTKKVLVGRAIVLAHGAGGSSSHSSMKAWKQRFSPLCDEVFMFNFPRPYQMAQLTAAFAENIGLAHEAGHRRIVLAGVGMGARTALHLLAGLPGDDEVQSEPLPAALSKCLVGVIALGYPLLRNGLPEVRDAAIRALPAEAPPLLLLTGANDPSTNVSDLRAAQEACAARAEMRVIEGTDAGLRAPTGTLIEKEATAALEEALATFAEGTLGTAEDREQ
jgi:predicted alpha/beta-hydrolase family hydrolase